MFCSHCEAARLDGAKFCHECGARYPAKDRPVRWTPTELAGALVGALMGGLLFMGVRAVLSPDLSSPTSTAAAQKVVVMSGLFGCQSREIFEKIGSYAVDHDTAVSGRRSRKP